MEKRKTNLTLLRKKEGSVFVTEPLEVRLWRAVDKSGGKDSCWEWQGSRHRKGHGEIAMPKGLKQKKAKVHRVVFELENGPIPEGMVICHACDNPSCCNPAHLFLGTHKTNREDCDRKGRHCHGTKTHTAKLNEEKVRQIRALDKSGRTRISISKEFGVSGRQITSICRYDNWKHVE